MSTLILKGVWFIDEEIRVERLSRSSLVYKLTSKLLVVWLWWKERQTTAVCVCVFASEFPELHDQ